MKKFLYAFVVGFGLTAQAQPFAQIGSVPGNSLQSFFGATNYFANDLPANTNGPLALYRRVGSSNISNLLADVTLGTISRFQLVCSSSPGDQGYGGLIWNTDHDSAGNPGTGVSEIGISGPKHIALVPGFGQGTSAHLQIGNINGFGGYAGQGLGYNNWMFMTIQGPIGQATATNFSGACAFNTGEFQGANYTVHYPGIFAYSLITNAPGVWGVMITSDLGNNGTELWDPNTAKPGRIAEFLGGRTNVVMVQSNLYVGGNFTLGNLSAFVNSDANTSVNTTFASIALNNNPIVTIGNKYRFTLTLFLDDSTAADGAKIDFNGGTAGVTNFRVHGQLRNDTGGVTALAAAASTTLAGVINATAMTTVNQHEFVFDGTFEPSSTGTLIPRFAQNAHSTGTLTVRRGSNLVLQTLP